MAAAAWHVVERRARPVLPSAAEVSNRRPSPAAFAVGRTGVPMGSQRSRRRPVASPASLPTRPARPRSQWVLEVHRPRLAKSAFAAPARAGGSGVPALSRGRCSRCAESRPRARRYSSYVNQAPGPRSGQSHVDACGRWPTPTGRDCRCGSPRCLRGRTSAEPDGLSGELAHAVRGLLRSLRRGERVAL